jgi:hypothetical protein
LFKIKEDIGDYDIKKKMLVGIKDYFDSNKEKFK